MARGEAAGPPWESIYHSGVISKGSFGLSCWVWSWAQGESQAGSRGKVRTRGRGLRDSGVSFIPSFGVDEKTQLKRGNIPPRKARIRKYLNYEVPGRGGRSAPRGRARAAEAGERRGRAGDGDGDPPFPPHPALPAGARHRQHRHLEPALISSNRISCYFYFLLFSLKAREPRVEQVCSAMLQPPNPPPSAFPCRQGLVVLLCLLGILWETHGAGQCKLEVLPAQGTWATTLLLPFLWTQDQDGRCWTCPPPPVWQGHPQPGHPLPPAAIPGASHPAGGGTSGLHGARLRFTSLGPSHLPRGAPGTGLSRPWLPRCPTAELIQGSPRRQLPPPRPGSLRVLPSCACE